jgi:hypothetical protein
MGDYLLGAIAEPDYSPGVTRDYPWGLKKINVPLIHTKAKLQQIDIKKFME